MESKDKHNADYSEHIGGDHGGDHNGGDHNGDHNGGDHSGGDMIHMITGYLEHLMDIFEIGIAIIVALGFITSVFPLVREIPLLLSMHTGTESYRHFLENALDLVIGIEFIKMLVKHTPGSVIEVLLFALSRHMVLAGGSARDNLLTVGAIAIIFGIRKFLFIETFEFSDHSEETDWLSDWKEIRRKGKRKVKEKTKAVNEAAAKEETAAKKETAAEEKTAAKKETAAEEKTAARKETTAEKEPSAEPEEAVKEASAEAGEGFEKPPMIDDFREIFDEPPVTDDFREV